ncbi:ATP-dependent DNA ligase [Jiangella ureilytica]|uniref:Probable DNA ligase n=1 Tax=Jiangella ureilytica TaxID=2530374 RepID=A0A4R4RJ84_9ACTN|nr:ATP-dependent DNA ligase [Jiangella ureilytica]TDC49648.1 ATP-dependent DNA ligase [Jiangella ureilytica]
MELKDVADTSAAVAGVSGRLAKTDLLAGCLRRADPAEAEVVASYLAGELRQRRTGLGYASLRDVPPPAGTPSLQVLDVDIAFGEIAELSGKGSTAARRERFRALMARATPSEQRLLAGLVSGELRQGALDGVLTEAVARASEVPAADVRRAVTVAGALVPVAAAVLANGAEGLTRFRLTVGSPLRPMLASPAPDIAEALERTGEAAVEWKLDGVRVQIHRDGSDVAVFTRTLDDITGNVPELVEAVLALPVRSVVLDGETIALDPSGRPLPFQRTGSRVSSRVDVATARAKVPLSLFVFDALHIDGADLIGLPGTERWAAMSAVVPAPARVPRLVTSSADDAQAFFDDAVAQGHEGVIVKGLDVPYEAGRRGSGWLKVKPRHTLDLAILAAEWGHGRRQGWLSNLHLGALDPAGTYGPAGGWVMLGKTFKGLTDTMLTWQTAELKSLADGPTDEWVVRVRPELLVEIAFDGVQTSPRYPAGVALRFARVLRHRPDKPAAEADTIDSVLAIRGPVAHEDGS